MTDITKLGSALLGATVGVLLAPPLALILGWLIALMLIDTIAAIIANGRAGKLDPTVGWLGWKRKSATILIILTVAIVQQIAGALDGAGMSGIGSVPAAAGVAGGFSLIEALSVIRNGRKCGVDLPAILRGAFAEPPAPPPQTPEGQGG